MKIPTSSSARFAALDFNDSPWDVDGLLYWGDSTKMLMLLSPVSISRGVRMIGSPNLGRMFRGRLFYIARSSRVVFPSPISKNNGIFWPKRMSEMYRIVYPLFRQLEASATRCLCSEEEGFQCIMSRLCSRSDPDPDVSDK